MTAMRDLDRTCYFAGKDSCAVLTINKKKAAYCETCPFKKTEKEYWTARWNSDLRLSKSEHFGGTMELEKDMKYVREQMARLRGGR